jgi:hypothetical protein
MTLQEAVDKYGEMVETPYIEPTPYTNEMGMASMKPPQKADAKIVIKGPPEGFPLDAEFGDSVEIPTWGRMTLNYIKRADVFKTNNCVEAELVQGVISL